VIGTGGERDKFLGIAGIARAFSGTPKRGIPITTIMLRLDTNRILSRTGTYNYRDLSPFPFGKLRVRVETSEK